MKFQENTQTDILCPQCNPPRKLIVKRIAITKIKVVQTSQTAITRGAFLKSGKCGRLGRLVYLTQ
jgi:hypothetical protein